MVITKRDTELFKKLSSYSMLSTKQVNNLCFGGIKLTTVLRRLRLLEQNKFIQRLLGLESKELLWTMLEKGASVASVSLPKRHYSKNLLEHDFKLLSLRLKLEESRLAHSWIPEHQIRSSIFRNNDFRIAKEKLIPDGIMGVSHNSVNQSIAIELELTLKNKDKLKKTLYRYKEKNELLAVWYIAPASGILNSVENIWRNLITYQKGPKLYLTRLQDVMDNPLEAKVFGDGNGVQIKNLWGIKTAQPSAQRLSKEIGLNENQNQGVSVDNNLENQEAAA